jgi:penicillin-binding protein 1C
MGLSWRLITGLGGAAALLLGGLVALDRLFPPDLRRFEDRSTIVTDAGGEVLRAFETRDGKWRLRTLPGDVDPRYLAMLKSYEDHRFDAHDGIDWAALLRAAASDAVALRAVSGGSTLTMQSARLLMPHQRSLGGKAIELLHARQLERRLTKDDILATYLTLAPFGGNVEGVRAAAMIYFGKEPRRLTIAQAALLVALPQSPERRRPDLHPDAARQARDKVLRRLQADGVISAAELADALSEPVPVQRLALPFLAPHLAGELADGAPGATIRTTLDGDLQRRLEAMLRRERLEDGAAIAALVVENAERQVRAYVGGIDFTAATGQVDLVRAIRSPGSTLKPFVYGIAFGDGLVHPETRILDAPIRLGDYAPQNFDRSYQGVVTVREALQMSLNIPAVAILDRVGPGRLVDMLDRGGAHLVFPSRIVSPSLPVVLGGVGTSLHDLVMLYAGLADGGRMRPLRVRASDDGGPAFRMLTPEASWYLTQILRGSAAPDGFASAGGDERPIAYKTGTSYGFRDAWAIGYSDDWTVGIWVGRPDGAPRPGHYGRNAAAPVLFRAFGLLPDDKGRRSPPSGIITATSRAALPASLRDFRTDPAAARDGRSAPLRILFPPDGAILDLACDGAAFQPIALSAEGGRGRLRWVADGAPLSSTSPGRPIVWTPDGPGFVHLSVVDDGGTSVGRNIRLVSASNNSVCAPD